MHRFRPPIELLEGELFGPADSTVVRWAGGDPSLDPAVVRALEADGQAVERRDALQSALAEPGQSTEMNTGEHIEIPEAIHDLIRRRVEANASRRDTFSPVPVAGQIVRLETATGPQAPPGNVLRRPAGVLLSAPVGEAWDGWLVAPETDYATWWDLLLTGEDEPFDPVAAMVQVWNPVRVGVPAGAVAMAQLRSPRLAAVKALFDEFLHRSAAAETDRPVPGRIGLRRTGEYAVLTGTPVGGRDDPRRHYQRLYSRLAGIVAVTAQEQPAGTRVRAVFTRLKRNLEHAVVLAGLPWERLAPISQPLGGGTEPEEIDLYRIGEGFEARLIFHLQDQAIQIHVRSTAGQRATLSLRQDEELLQEEELGAEQSEVDFFVDPNQSYVLVIQIEETGQRYELPLT